jgi:hypothetical protein
MPLGLSDDCLTIKHSGTGPKNEVGWEERKEERKEERREERREEQQFAIATLQQRNAALQVQSLRASAYFFSTGAFLASSM